MSRRIEVYVHRSLVGPDLDRYVAHLRAAGAVVQVRVSAIYSYQGRDPSIAQQPADWGVEQCPAGDLRYAAASGERLVCIGTEDRYQYVESIGLAYSKYTNVAEALAAVGTVA